MKKTTKKNIQQPNDIDTIEIWRDIPIILTKLSTIFQYVRVFFVVIIVDLIMLIANCFSSDLNLARISRKSNIIKASACFKD